ncbi:hypothetical protein EON65_38490 [archaeon]|nr:MAG: hypothetical protein EON65_38490 [archaeon]
MYLAAAPWSAPSWLKVYGTLTPYNNSNTLLHTDAAYSTYSQYLGKAVQSFRDLGLAVDYVSVQNEPLFGTSSEYPGMFLSAEDSFKLNVLLRTELDRLGLATQLLSYDHNWDHPEYPLDQLTSAGGDGSKVFGGVAWHCYGGDMSFAQDAVHSAYPHTLQLLTECTGAYPAACDVTQGMTGFGYNHEWDMQNLLLGGAGHWSSGALKWILVLDEECGPTLPTVTFNNGRPLVSITSSNQVYFNQDYWSIAHMSKFLIPMVSQRVQSDILVANSETHILTQSFVDIASGQVVCIVMNLDHDHDAAIELNDKVLGKSMQDSLPPFSTKIYMW